MHGVRKGAEFEMITEVICVDSKGEQHVVGMYLKYAKLFLTKIFYLFINKIS